MGFAESRHPMACPVCKLRMELMHRQGDHVTAGCTHCQISMTMPAAIWDAAKIERDAATLEHDARRGDGPAASSAS
jgi:hypothetical protein